jgi:two-component system, NarL family, nitrate/nitrite response regulator NarL
MERLPFETVLVSANALLREGLTRILGTAGFHIAASGSFVDDEALDSLPQVPAILLIIDASDDFDAAIGQIEPLKLHCPTGRVAILVGQHQLQLPQMVSAFRAGANAYLTNFTTPEAFIKSLELVMLGEAILPSAMLDHLLNHQRGRPDRRKNFKQNGSSTDEDGNEDDHEVDGRNDEDDDFDAIKAASPDVEGNYSPHLSARQMSILRCLIKGDSNKAIARKMKIADATVKVHVKAILRKIRVDNHTQAAIWAMRNGSLISADRKSSLDGEKLSIPQVPSLQFSESLSLQALSSRCKNGPASSPALGFEGVHHVALPGVDHPKGKGLHQKDA